MSTLSQKSESVAENGETTAKFGDCRTFLQQCHFSDSLTFLRQNVALFCDSVDRLFHHHHHYHHHHRIIWIEEYEITHKKYEH